VKTLLVIFVALLAFAAPARAQDRLPIGTRVGNTTPEATSGYEDGGRRDPFVSLLVKKASGPSAPVSRPRVGLSGVNLADVEVKGILHAGPAVMVVLQGPEGKSFIAKSQDHLQDAVIKSIDADGVVFVEHQVDAVGAVHSRDVRKALRPTAEGIR
jgi:hypothetical protein